MTKRGISAGLAEIERFVSWRRAGSMATMPFISVFCCWSAFYVSGFLFPTVCYVIAHGFMFWGMQRAGSAIGREALAKTWDYQCLGSANPLAWLLSRYIAETLPSWLGASVALVVPAYVLAGRLSFDLVEYIAITVMPMIAAHAIAFALGALVYLPPVTGRFLRWGAMALAVIAWFELAIVTIGYAIIPMFSSTEMSIEFYRWWGLFPVSTSAYMVLWSLSIAVCAFAYGAWILGIAFGRPENIPCGIVFAFLAIPLLIAGWVFAPSESYIGHFFLASFELFDARPLRFLSPNVSAWFVLAYLVFAFGRDRAGPQIVIAAGFALLFAWLVLSADAKDQDILLFAFFTTYALRDGLIVWLFRVARKSVGAAFLTCVLLRWPVGDIVSGAWPGALVLLFPHQVPDAGWISLLGPLLISLGLFLAGVWMARYRRVER